MSKIHSKPPLFISIPAEEAAKDAAIKNTQARIVGHQQPPLELPAQTDYLRSAHPEIPPIKATSERTKPKAILLPPPEQISGFRAYDHAYISYLQTKEKPLVEGALWLAENGELYSCDFQRWFQLTGMVYLPYLLFSEKNLLEQFNGAQRVEPNWQAHLTLLDKLYLKKISEQVGWGVFARTNLVAGEIIGEYAGVVHSHKTGGTYTMAYQKIQDQALNIDARFMGNITRFVNHSERPNIEAIETVTADGILHIEFKLLKNISTHQQLFIDYGSSYWIYQQPQQLEV